MHKELIEALGSAAPGEETSPAAPSTGLDTELSEASGNSTGFDTEGEESAEASTAFDKEALEASGNSTRIDREAEDVSGNSTKIDTETENLPALSTAFDKAGAEAQSRLERARRHLDALWAQAEALRRDFPDFDLSRALRDPDFVRLTAPDTGVDLRRAYYAMNRERLDALAAARAAQETRAGLARSLATGGQRPREGGGQQAAAALAADYRQLSRPQQQALKQRIREAAARGEKLYP